jgi:NTE family protein
VLSLGAADGVALLGAIAAVKRKHVPISCAVGSGVGALIGALYASAPAEDTRVRFEEVVREWGAATGLEARRKGLGLALLFGPVAMYRNEMGESPAMEPGSEYRRRLDDTDRRDWDRLVGVLNRFFGGLRIEALTVPYAAISFQPRGPAAMLVPARTGSIAEAVAASVANPLVFPDHDDGKPAAGRDPANDQANVTPIHQACLTFPGARLLAINVSGRPSLYRARMRCSLREVSVAPAGLSPEQVLERGPAYRNAIDRGFAATLKALEER